MLIEGYKSQAHPKIEAHRAATGRPLLSPANPSIRAVASDCAPETALPCFDLDDTAAIADFILGEVGL
ncbi:molybdopterin-guanine dinucleotide biosynthesis protein B [Mangrovicoccus ximenensis]|uniref:molybdopterin-guanine dinucleotide biosynthesis protein B n=1 Tax=Mangrovicoccus ximenensis TaxID=1911570 RepID=UPI0038B3338E